MERFDVVVIGAGAAGLMAGIEAARRGRRVLVADHAAKAGEKIRISGGGRCNFTNLGIAPERFISRNPRFALSALRRFTQWDFIDRLGAAGISWHEKTLGQLFCDGSAKAVVEMLLADLAGAGGALRCSFPLSIPRAVAGGFEMSSPAGPLRAASVVIATGGKSIPKMGASGFGLEVAQGFGLPVVETRPGLVPMTFAQQELDWIAPLAGVSAQVAVSAGKARFAEGMLFTHRGLSGPAILQASNYWREGEEIAVELLSGRDALAVLRRAHGAQGKAGLASALAGHLPEKLARHLQERLCAGVPLASLSLARLGGLAETLANWRLKPVGTEGYRTAEVMLGGVDTEALDGRSLAAKSVPGLYFVGEVVDVTGWLGGYNFQWAWSSGWAAGQEA